MENGVARHFAADFLSDAEPSSRRFHASFVSPDSKSRSRDGIIPNWRVIFLQCKPLIANRDMDTCL